MSATPTQRVGLASSPNRARVSNAIDLHLDALAIMRLAEVAARQLADELGKGSGDLAASIGHSLEIVQQMVVEIGTTLERAEIELEKASKIGRST